MAALAWPSRGHGNSRITLGITSYGLAKPDNASEEVAKGPLMVSGGGAQPIARPWLHYRHLGPSTTGPKKADRGFFGTLHTWGTYPDRP